MDVSECSSRPNLLSEPPSSETSISRKVEIISTPQPERKHQSDWDYLSEDVHILILRKLPLFTQIRAKQVSRSWNRMLKAAELHTRSDPHTLPPQASRTIPIYFSHGQLVVLDPGKNSWGEQPLDYLSAPPHSLSLLDASGGLLCFKSEATQGLILCNPVTMRSRNVALPEGFSVRAITEPLPDLLKPVVTLESGRDGIESFQRVFGRDAVVGLVAEKHRQWFSVVVAGIFDERRVERATWVWDSFAERWSRGPWSPGAQFWESGKTVSAEGFLYCLTFTAGLSVGTCGLDRPWSIVRYDVEQDDWTEIKLCRRGSILPQLVEHGGRIWALQRDSFTGNEILFSELQGESSVVRSFASRHLPFGLFGARMKKKRCPMIMQDWCVGRREWIFIAGRYRDGACSSGLVILAHNFKEDVWVRLPTLADATVLQGHFSAALHGFHNATRLHAFEPSLAARV